MEGGGTQICSHHCLLSSLLDIFPPLAPPFVLLEVTKEGV